jgi:hypothetical protein
MGETGTFDRQGAKDRPKDRVMRPLTVAEVPTLRAVALLAQIRLHLPLHHNLLDGLKDGLAFRQRQAKRLGGKVRAFHTGHFTYRFLAVITERDDLHSDRHGSSPLCQGQVRVDGAAIDVVGLKLLIRLKAVNGVLQRVKSPDGFPHGFSD